MADELNSVMFSSPHKKSFFCIIFLTISANCVFLADFPFRNTSLPLEERVVDLVYRLSLEEMVLQLTKGGGDPNGGPAPAIHHLKISPYQWETECLHGDALAGNATSFPQALGLAATFDLKLMYRVSTAIGNEVRAKYNNYSSHSNYNWHTGASCLSPVINIMRHPFWGRNQESYGEDPFLTGKFAEMFVKGIQGEHPKYLRVSATCKHFAAYAGPENIPMSRFVFNANVSNADLFQTFLPQFKACVESGAYSVMCSYNSVNGIPACANHKLLTEILRNSWKFTGYVISDEGAMRFNIDFHKYFKSDLESAIGSFKAGVNLDLPRGTEKNPVYLSLLDAVTTGVLSKYDLLERLKPLFYTRMKLGEFDPVENNPYSKLDLKIVLSPQHLLLAEEAAVKSFVLLKNVNKFLPFKSILKSIAIIGPMANNFEQLNGNYAAETPKEYVSMPYYLLKHFSQSTKYTPGCFNSSTLCTSYNKTEILNAIKGVQTVFLFLGTGPAVESESRDRDNLSLPGYQQQILTDVIENCQSNIVLFVFSASPVDIAIADESPNVKAIFQGFFPGQSAGNAVVNVLFNKGGYGNPAARLPFTWYQDKSQIPSMTDYTMKEKTYRYFTGNPLYPFGYGLSYTYFVYRRCKPDPSYISQGQDTTVHVLLSNDGEYDGDEVVQVYLKWPDRPYDHVPLLQLVYFERVHLKVGEVLEIDFTLKTEQTQFWDDTKNMYVQMKGDYQLYCGGQMPGNHHKMIPGSNIVNDDFVVQ